MEKYKTLIYVDTKGQCKINPEENPAKNLFVIKSYENQLLLEAPVVGFIATEAQIATIKEFSADWIMNRNKAFTVKKVKNCVAHSAIKEDEDDKSIRIPYLSLKVDPGKLDEDQTKYASGKILAWLAEIVKVPAEEEKPAAEKAAPAAPAAPVTPPPAEEKKETPPAEKAGEKKETPPAAEKAEEKKETPPAAEKAEEKKEEKPTKRYPDLEWDPDKSPKENVLAMMGPMD